MEEEKKKYQNEKYVWGGWAVIFGIFFGLIVIAVAAYTNYFGIIPLIAIAILLGKMDTKKKLDQYKLDGDKDKLFKK